MKCLKYIVLVAVIIVMQGLNGCMCFAKTEQKITSVKVNFRGIDETNDTAGLFKSKPVGIMCAVEIVDSIAISEFEKYRLWKNSEDYKAVRNAQIIISFSNRMVDTLEAVLYRDISFVEFKDKGKTVCRLIPKRLHKYLQEKKMELPSKAGWRKI